MSPLESEQRAAVIAEALTWLGTPFGDCSDVKGPNGCVDCAMLLVRVFVDSGVIPRFDPRYTEAGEYRPYSSQWFMHRDEEVFMNIVRRFSAEVARPPIPGDVILFQVGRCYAHGAILIDEHRIVHAYKMDGKVVISRLAAPRLAFLNDGRPRPRKVFDMWAKSPVVAT